MFRASSAHLQEDTVVQMQHMVLSPLWEFLVACRYTAWVRTHSNCVPTSSWRVTVPYAAFVQLYPPEDEHLRLETSRGD